MRRNDLGRPRLRLIVANQPQLSFVHERRGLQSLTWLFASEACRRKAAKLFINKRKQLVGRRWIAAGDLFEDVGDFSHTPRVCEE